MKDLFIFFAVLNTITLLSLLFYFPIVWLNMVFTFSELSTSNIPYYNTDLECFAFACFFFSQTRYHWLWWELATDVFRIFLPVLPLYNMLLIQYFKWKEIFWSYTIPICLLAVVEIFKSIKIAVGLSICNEVQSCRNFKSADPTVKSYQPNYVYISTLAFSLGFFLLCVIYGCVGGKLTQRSIKRASKLHVV